MTNKVIIAKPTCQNRNRRGVRCGMPYGHKFQCQNGPTAPPSTFDQNRPPHPVDEPMDRAA